MRTINIPSTRVAYERLATLKHPLALAIPFDEERIAPFGIRIKTLPNGCDRVLMTFEGQDFGIVDNFDGEKVVLSIAIDASPPVERAIQKVFKIINAHTSQVAKVMAEENRILKTQDHDSPEAQEVVRAQESRRRSFLEAQNQGFEAQRREDERLECAGWGVPHHEGHVVVLEGLTPDDITSAGQLSAYADGIDVRKERRFLDDDTWQNGVKIATKGGKTWYFADTGAGLVLQDEHRFAPDLHRMVPHILGLAERNRRLADTAHLLAPLEALPPATYAIERFAMSDIDVRSKSAHRHALSEIASLEIMKDVIHFRVEGVVVAEWRLWRNQADIKHVVKLSISNSVDPEAFSDPQILAKIGDVWMREYLGPQGVDLEAFRPFNVDEIEDDAVRADFGYTF